MDLKPATMALAGFWTCLRTQQTGVCARVCRCMPRACTYACVMRIRGTHTRDANICASTQRGQMHAFKRVRSRVLDT